MRKRPRRIRSFARTAPKTLEKKLIENARTLANDPYLILPKPLDRRAEKIVDKIKREVGKVYEIKESREKLEKLSKKRGLNGALAGTLLLVHNPRAPYLAHINIMGKEVVYAIRGKSDKEKLIAVQHFDDPVLRLMGFRDIAAKKKLCLYSWDNRFVCSSPDNDVPDDFREFLRHHLGLNRIDNIIFCDHLNHNEVDREKALNIEYLLIMWRDLRIALCKDCLTERNTFIEMSKYFIDPNLQRSADVRIISRLCEIGIETAYVDDYLRGEISDAELLKRNRDSWKKKLQEMGKKVVVANGIIYEDMKTFVKSLKPNALEERALLYILNKINEPLFLDEPSVNSILSPYWKVYGKEILKVLSEDKKLVESVYNLRDPPSKQIERLAEITAMRERLSRYPSYSSLPPVAKFIDELAKSYIAYGKEKVLTLLSKPPGETKKRAIAYAFLLHFGKGEEKRWQYTKEEIEFGEFLKRYVDDLLNAPPSNYHESLKKLLSACGIDEDI